MKAQVKEYFECPSCGQDFLDGETIFVKSSPMGIGATHYCSCCSCQIELLLNDDRTVEL